MPDHQLQIWTDIRGHAEAVPQLVLDTYGPERAKDSELMKSMCMTPACFGVVAYRKDEPAGFILLQEAGDSADIIEICVRPLLQNSGIGRQLLEQALSSARTRCLAKVLLEVAVTNQPALKLYRSAGFVLVGKRPHYYRLKSGKVDALVMAHSLSGAYQV